MTRMALNIVVVPSGHNPLFPTLTTQVVALPMSHQVDAPLEVIGSTSFDMPDDVRVHRVYAANPTVFEVRWNDEVASVTLVDGQWILRRLWDGAALTLDVVR